LVVEVGKEVAQELEESAAWYEKEDPGLGAPLFDAFANAVRLLEAPIRR
jgi:toxin ParE1/3/4